MVQEVNVGEVFSLPNVSHAEDIEESNDETPFQKFAESECENLPSFIGHALSSDNSNTSNFSYSSTNDNSDVSELHSFSSTTLSDNSHLSSSTESIHFTRSSRVEAFPIVDESLLRCRRSQQKRFQRSNS